MARFRYMGAIGTAAAKAGPAAARGLFSVAWRRWRPDTSHAALDLHADDLADRVRRAETPSLEQLGAVSYTHLTLPTIYSV